MGMLVSNYIELCNLLLKEFSDRMFIDQIGLLLGVIQGKLDDQPFVINFSEEGYLNIMTNFETREVLDEFLFLGKNIMGGVEPLCTYDIQYMNNEGLFSSITWDIYNPIMTKFQLENEVGFDDNMIIHNLNFYGSNKILLRTSYRYNKED